MGIIDQKARVETPDEWHAHISKARTNPFPFVVIDCVRDMFKNYTSYLKPTYKPSCPFPTHPVRDFWVTSDKPVMVLTRENYNGSFVEYPVLKRVSKARILPPASVLTSAYDEALPLNKKKYDDLCFLSKFCSSATAVYFKNLPYLNTLSTRADNDPTSGESDRDNDND